MLAIAYEKKDGNYGRWTVVHELDSEALTRAREIFKDYHDRGIILNDNFDDPAWTLANQTKNVGLTLIAFEGHFYKKASTWVGCGYQQYQDCVKAYIALNLGEFGLMTLQELSNTLISLAGKSNVEATDSAVHTNHIIDFLQMLPGCCSERDCVIETLEERAEKHPSARKGKQRRLADFHTYLKFNDALSDFWAAAGRRQRLFYFPLYFWWNLTSILPLRPTEFLLTPRDCLQDGNILTVRRTKLKGGSRKIAYRVEDDYERKQYVIPEYLTREIQAYLQHTKKMRPTGIDTLFLQQPHFNYMGLSCHSSSKYYSYAYLRTCLRYFCDETHYGGIARIHLGDTRHIAMASLILSGGSPVICMELAGHSDIDVSSHYYSNISNLVECVTLERYRKSKDGGAVVSGAPKYPLALPKIKSRVSSGWCGSPEVAAGSIDDCLKACGKKGSIGDCSQCGFYFPDNPGIRLEFLDETKGKRQVDEDCRHLIRMIELTRKGLGHQEDIGSALLRLQRSANHYGNCLWEKYERKDAAQWQGQKR